MKHRKMVILHVARNPPSGVWSMIRLLSECQVGLGHTVFWGFLLNNQWPHWGQTDFKDVTLLSAYTPCVFGTAAFAFHCVTESPVRAWIKQIRWECGEVDILVHYHDAWLSGALIVDNGKCLKGIVQLVTFHGVGACHPLHRQPVRRWIHRQFAKRLLKHSCWLTSVDKENTLVAQELLKIPAERFSVIPNGVHATERLYAWDASSITIGFVGILNEAKGWRICAEAAEKVYAKGFALRLVIAGSGPEGELAKAWCDQRPEFAEFRGYVRDAGKNLIPTLQIVCLPSRMEGMPVAILEAMMSGAVVIATSVGGVPDMIRTGETGILVERSVKDVEEALERLCNDLESIERIGSNARKLALEEFSIEACWAKYEEQYRKLVARSGDYCSQESV